MAKDMQREVVYRYDLYPTEEELMGDSTRHLDLVLYLVLVLRWLFEGQVCGVYANLNFYQTPDPEEHPIVPDVAIVKGMAQQDVQSWRVGETGPAPQVVFEIGSLKTWFKDLGEKPVKYAQMGVQEYFAYDPSLRPILKGAAQRLFGWRLDPTRRQMRPIPSRADGGLWSAELESWLVPDGKHLRLYDRNGQRRLTQGEAEAQARERAERQVRAAEQRAERQVRAAEQRAEAEAQARQLLLEKLRSHGIDPDQL